MILKFIINSFSHLCIGNDIWWSLLWAEKWCTVCVQQYLAHSYLKCPEHSDPTRDWARLACECPGVSGGSVGRQWPALGLGALTETILIWALKKEVFLLPLPLLRPSYGEGTQPHPSRENRVKDLLSTAPPIRARPRFPHNQFLSSRSFHEPLILTHQRADRMKTTIIEN